MKKIIDVTPAAVAYIKSAVSEGEYLGMRIDVQPGGCVGTTYKLDFVTDINPSDVIAEEDGIKIYISSKAVIFVENMKIDYVKNAMGGSIVFENPNAKMNCSCGKSFCVDMDAVEVTGRC